MRCKADHRRNARANALLGLSVVEWSLSRYDKSFKILSDNATLFRKITSHSLKGFYHNQLAIVLRTSDERGKDRDQVAGWISANGPAPGVDRRITIVQNKGIVDRALPAVK